MYLSDLVRVKKALNRDFALRSDGHQPDASSNTGDARGTVGCTADMMKIGDEVEPGECPAEGARGSHIKVYWKKGDIPQCVSCFGSLREEIHPPGWGQADGGFLPRGL